MAEAAADPFAGAKANLRDTVKWLATAFAGIGAAVLAGTSLTGIAGLEGTRLALALGCGAAGLICVFVATGILLSLLTSESFVLSQIDADPALKARLNQRADDILPPEFASLDAFLGLRREAIAVIRTTANDPQRHDAYKQASAFYASIEPAVARLVNLAHFEVLRSTIARRRWWVFILAIGALLGLGAFAVLVGTGKSPAAAASDTILLFDPGNQWSGLAKALTANCGTAPLKVQLVGAPQPGWITVRLLSPEPCAGALLTVPSSVMPGEKR
jgi:hypothetical protein